jgi:hypothetical protein
MACAPGARSGSLDSRYFFMKRNGFVFSTCRFTEDLSQDIYVGYGFNISNICMLSYINPDVSYLSIRLAIINLSVYSSIIHLSIVYFLCICKLSYHSITYFYLPVCQVCVCLSVLSLIHVSIHPFSNPSSYLPLFLCGTGTLNLKTPIAKSALTKILCKYLLFPLHCTYISSDLLLRYDVRYCLRLLVRI